METFDKIIDFTRTTSGSYVDSDGKIKITAPSKNLLLRTQESDNSSWGKSGATALPFDPALATLGPELVTNGTFASDLSGWNVGTDPLQVVPTWSSGSVVLTRGSSGSTGFSQAITLTYGRFCRISFDVTSGVAAVGGAFNSTGGLTGSVTLYLAITGGASIQFWPNSPSSSCTIDNISVREVIGGLITAPDGTLTADAVLPTATTVAHNVQQAGGGSGSPLALSVYAKAGSHAFMQLSHGSLSAIYANFNLLTGVVGTFGANATASIVPAGDGWYRCTMTFTPGAAANLAIGHITSETAGYRESWAATGTESIYLWGAQLEVVPDANLVLGAERVSSPTITAINANGSVSVVGDTITCTCTAAGTFGFKIAALNAVLGQSYRLFVNLLTNSASRSIFADIGGYNIGYGTATGAIVRASAKATTMGAYHLYATNGQIGDTFSVSLSSLSVKEITDIIGMPTDYTRNVGGLYPPRFDYDPVTLVPRGLLIEEQRTNLLLWSEKYGQAIWSKSSATITANAAVSPDGTANADKLVEAAANAAHYALQDIGSAVPDNTTFTTSIYVKAAGRTEARLEGRRKDGLFWSANFDLAAATLVASSNVVGTPTIEPVGNGWFRISASATSSAGASTLTFVVMLRSGGAPVYLGDGTSGVFLWGAQLEAGAFATSYIPTAASQVTRAADNAVITGANFSRWYNQSEGTLVVEYSLTAPTATKVKALASANTGSTNDRVYVYVNNYGIPNILVAVGGTTQVTVGSGLVAGNTVVRTAVAYKTDDFAISTSGESAVTGTSGAVPAVNRLEIGVMASNAQPNGHIRRIRYYPTRLSNTQLQALTA